MTGYPSIDKPWLKYYDEQAINIDLPCGTLYEYVKACNHDSLNEIAIVYYGKEYTYGQMFSEIDNLANSFKQLGVKEGSIVSLCTLSIPETVFTIYALNKLGAICNIIEPRTDAKSICQRIKETDSNILVLLDVFWKKIHVELAELQLSHVIVQSLCDSMAVETRIGFELTKGWKIPKVPVGNPYIKWNKFIKLSHEVDGVLAETGNSNNAVAAIIYTGGTTGLPKGAELKNEGINSIALEYRVGLNQKRGESFLNIMPPFIAYGLVFGLHTPFCSGLKVILIPSFKPEDIGKLFKKYKPNHYIGVPSHFEHLLNCKEMKNVDMSFLITAGMGGDSLNPVTEKAINDFLKKHNSPSRAMKGYGMTEMGSSACTTTLGCNKIGSVGIPLVKNIISIFEPDSYTELKYGEKGEICITGPGMMLAYVNNPEETSRVMRRHPDGRIWIHSQDIGYMDEDGSLFIVDRIKRMIIRPDGHNVWPSRIEAMVAEHPNVKECAVVGLKNPNGKNGKIPTAFIRLNSKENSEEFLTEIDMYCKERMPERDCAMKYIIIDSLPLTAVGKVDYRRLEEY